MKHKFNKPLKPITAKKSMAVTRTSSARRLVGRYAVIIISKFFCMIAFMIENFVRNYDEKAQNVLFKT